MNARAGFALLLLVALLSACASSDGPGDSAFRQEAARLNTDLGVGYLRQGRLDLAQARLERAVEQDPRYASAHGVLALVYEMLGETARAEAQYRSGLPLTSGDPGLQNGYAVFLCRQQRHAEALEYFDRAVADRRYATPEAALTNAGICLLDVPDAVRAETYLRRALEREPAHAEAMLQMAQLMHDRGDHPGAQEFLRRYLDVAAATPQVLSLARHVELALGNAAAAGEYAQRLQREFPDAVETRELLDEA